MSACSVRRFRKHVFAAGIHRGITLALVGVPILQLVFAALSWHQGIDNDACYTGLSFQWFIALTFFAAALIPLLWWSAVAGFFSAVVAATAPDYRWHAFRVLAFIALANFFWVGRQLDSLVRDREPPS